MSADPDYEHRDHHDPVFHAQVEVGAQAITQSQLARPAELVLIGQMADALSVCSEMLNGRDQMTDALTRPNAVPQKSPLTSMVDEAMQAWREWQFQPIEAASEKGTS